MKEKYNTIDILSDKKVLYAEDESGIRQNIVEVLELFFDTVVDVDNGLDAISEFQSNSFDILIFDISMPNIDGLEAIKKIRQLDKKIPIIILSAHTEQEYLWRAVELKITKYLIKPYDKDKLMEALELSALELINFHKIIQLTPNCQYDPSKKTIICNFLETKLSKNESKLLEYFIAHPNKMITYEMIYDYIWEFNTPTKEAIKSLIKDIRKKLDKDIIKNMYGVGYIFKI